MAIASNFPAIRPSLNLDFANTKALDPRITFSRASAATYYDGKTVAKAEENLLTYSQEFDSVSWVKPFDTVSANTVSAPDGTMTADTLTAAVVNNYHTVEQLNTAVAANNSMAVSVYAKAGTYGLVSINIESGMYGWVAATFDISSGAVTKTGSGTAGAHITSSISSVGGGWYRILLVGQTTATISKVKIALASSATPTYANYANDIWTPAGTESIYIWGAQLEQRSQVAAYTPTTTQPITNYIPVLQTAPAGVPRFDHNPVTGESLGLLVEEQRTNLLTYSEKFDDISWTKFGTSVISNTVVAPDGTFTADTVVFTNGNVADRLDKTVNIYPIPGEVYTYSVWLKGSGTLKITVNSSNGTGGSAELTVNLESAWKRYAVTHTFLADVTGVLRVHGVIIRDNSKPIVDIWGAQLEAGAFPTSYIKTEASQVTRAADSASMTGANFSSWYRQGEGTLFSDAVWDYGSDSGVFMRYVASLFDVSNANSRIAIYNYNGAGGAYIALNNVGQAAVNGVTHTASPVKSVIAYALNNSSGSVNGYAPTSNTNCLMPSAIAALTIGAIIPGVSTLNGHIKRLSYYPKRLSNSELQALTA